jgi:hypothetical protein
MLRLRLHPDWAESRTVSASAAPDASGALNPRMVCGLITHPHLSLDGLDS